MTGEVFGRLVSVVLRAGCPVIEEPEERWDDISFAQAERPDSDVAIVGCAARASMLVERIGDGDRDAFDDFYRLTAVKVLAMIVRLLGDRTQAHEVHQEVFLEVWRRADRYEPGRGSALGWVMTLARRRAVDRIRSERARSERETAYAARAERPRRDEVFDTVSKHITCQSVVSILHGLTVVQRECVFLVYYHGLSRPEAAARLEVSLPAVNSRIHGAVTKLRSSVGADATQLFRAASDTQPARTGAGL